MTDPRRPDDARLSTADLAAAATRATERDVERGAPSSRAGRQWPIATGEARRDSDDEQHPTPLFADERDATTSVIAGPTSRRASSTSPVRRWRTLTRSSRRRSNGWRRSSRRSARTSSSSGRGAATCPRRTCAWRCAATGASSIGCCLSRIGSESNFSRSDRTIDQFDSDPDSPR